MVRTARQKAAARRNLVQARKKRRFGRKHLVAAAAVGYVAYRKTHPGKKKVDTTKHVSRTPKKVADYELKRAARGAKRDKKKAKKFKIRSKSRGLRAIKKLSRGRR